MALKRRAFLRGICLTLGGLGLNETGWVQLGDRYHQVLAQPTVRKLALLIGINQYSKVPALNGCLTDVELQRELLLYRFGFQASDILTLTDQRATRSNIETAFVSHLIEQARPGDVVVFHFSGYGRQVHLGGTQAEATSGAYGEQNALVPVDGVVLTGAGAEEAVNHEFLEDTLFLLLRSLQTDQVTTILDTSYTYPGTPLLGNLHIRARPRIDLAQLAAAELAFQARLLQQNQLSRAQVRVQQQANQMPGMVLAAAKPTQIAAEAQWHGFSAGLFTYALTQHLWQVTPATTLRVSLNRVATAVEQRVGKEQQPSLSGQKSAQTLLPAYEPDMGMAADGAVIGVDDNGKSGKIWLSGLPPEVIETYSPGSVLTLLPLSASLPPAAIAAGDKASPASEVVAADAAASLTPSEPESGRSLSMPQQIQLQSGNSLVVKGLFLGQEPVQIGQRVQETLRVLPRNISLTVALDSSLERIERVDATSALSTMPRISPVIAGEQPADCLFAKLLTNPSFQAHPGGETSQNQRSSYGLFSVGKELLPNSLGEAGEAIKAAVLRLSPKLQNLLGVKLLGLTVNESSSRLGVSATLETVAPEPQVLCHQATTRSPWSAPTPPPLAKDDKIGSVVTVPVGSRIQYRINNYSDRPVYLVVFGIDSSANAFTFCATTVPANSLTPQPLLKTEVIAPGTTLTLPQTSNTFEWMVHGPAGLATTYLVMSHQPLTRTLAAIETVVRQKKTSEAQQLVVLPNPLEVVSEILQDLQGASEAAAVAAGISSEWLAFDVNGWATFRFTYRTV